MEAVSGLVPELLVSNLQTSLGFWVGMLDFSVRYDRPEEGFAYLRRDVCDVMLEQLQDGQRSWKTGELSKPFGRGINFQMENADWSVQLSKLRETAWPFYLEPEDKWYRAGDEEVGQRQFLVQDPDGYLLRLCQPIGRRKLS